MSKESALRFLNTLGTNEKAKELLQQRKPANEEEKIQAYAEIAAELGEPITEEDFRNVFRELKEQVQKKAVETASGIQALEDDDVEDVAGGYYYFDDGMFGTGAKIYNECSNDFTDTSCWWDDACDMYVIGYFACDKNYHKGDYR